MVFVGPFTPHEYHDMLQAMGAIIRELELIAWHPKVATLCHWKDLFSKLNIWGDRDLNVIAFLDLGAFLVQNIDAIFDLTKKQQCRPDLLPREDRKKQEEIREYFFTGTEVGGHGAGLGVVKTETKQKGDEYGEVA